MNLLQRDERMVGVRPEDMKIAATHEAGGGLEAVVESIEYLGADSLVAARWEGQSLLVRGPGRSRLAVGESIRVAWEAAHEHHFDKNTGGRQP